MRGLKTVLVAVALLGAPVVVSAQGAPLQITVENVTLKRDSVRAKGATKAALPTDTLRYALTFTNRETRAVRNVVFENPLPAGLMLLGGTVTTSAGARVEYSIDGGRTYAERPVVSVMEGGRRVERAAAPGAYTHIRWTTTDAVAPGARVIAQYDARLGRREGAPAELK